MQEIIHAFGIDWRLIAIQIVNFGLLAGVLWYFLYTPVLTLLSEREAKIKQGVEDAENAKNALASADAEKTVIVKDAHTEATHIVARATQYAEEKSRVLLDEAAQKVVREIENAKATALEIQEQALKKSEAEIAKLAILGAEKVLNAELSK